MLILIRENGEWIDHGHSVSSRRSGEKLMRHLSDAYGQENVRIVSVKAWKEIALKQTQDQEMHEAQLLDEQRRREELEMHPEKERLRQKRIEYFKKRFTSRKRKRED